MAQEQYHCIVSLAHFYDCFAFIQTSPLKLINQWLPYKHFDYFQKGVAGCCVCDNNLFFVHGREAGKDIVCSHIIKDKDGLYDIDHVITARNVGNNLHDLVCYGVYKDGGKMLLFAANTFDDEILVVQIDAKSNNITKGSLFSLGVKGIHDLHHLNSIHVYTPDRIYVTAAHKNDKDRKKEEGDVLMISKSQNENTMGKWLNLKNDQGKPYMFPHDYYHIGPHEYMINDSKNGDFVWHKDGKDRRIFLGGWSRGLCLLPDGSVLVGASFDRQYKLFEDNDHTAYQSTIFHISKDMEIIDKLVLDKVNKLSAIYSIRRFNHESINTPS